MFSQDYVIVLEEEVILAQDFLSFLAQCLSVARKDDSLIGVSAWNENGKYISGIIACHTFTVFLLITGFKRVLECPGMSWKFKI